MYPNPTFGGQPPGYAQSYQGDQQSYFQFKPAPQRQWGPPQPPPIQPPFSAPPSGLMPGGTSSQPCFNCGSTAHWAQYCPEPRRATPAGTLTNPSSNSGFTFQKPGGPTITRYAPPSTHQPPQLYSQPPPSGIPNGPPTPMSAYSQPQGQPWQQHSNSQFSPVSVQGSPYTPHTPQGYPTPVTPYGPQYNGPASGQGTPYSNANFHPQGQYQHRFGPTQPVDSQFYPNEQQYPPAPNQASLNLSPHLPQPPYSSYGSQQLSQGNAQNSPSNGNQFAAQQGDVTYSPPTDQIWSSGQEDAQLIEHNALVIKWIPAEAVGRPLAATFSQAEAQGILPPPPTDGDRKSVSKYFSTDNLSEICVSIRDTVSWKFLKDDPVFREIGDDKGLIPVDQLPTGLDQYGGGVKQVDGKSSSAADGAQDKPNQHEWSVMDSLERALDTGDFSAVAGKAPQAKAEPFDIAEMEQLDKAEELTEKRFIHQTPAELPPSSRIDDAQEEMLARLGVTGSPKPVVPSLNRRNSRMSEPSGGQASRRRSRSPVHDRRQSSGSRSSSTHTISRRGYRERDPVQPYAESRGISRQDSYGVGENHMTSIGSNDRRASGSQYGRFNSYEKAPPPPPPPPPNGHFDIGFDGRSQQSSEGTIHPSHASPGIANGGAAGNDGRRSASPSGSRLRTSNTNPRNYRERENLRQAKGEPQRQPDDLAAKRKRSQPQVSEVWLRRW